MRTALAPTRLTHRPHCQVHQERPVRVPLRRARPAYRALRGALQGLGSGWHRNDHHGSCRCKSLGAILLAEQLTPCPLTVSPQGNIQVSKSHLEHRLNGVIGLLAFVLSSAHASDAQLTLFVLCACCRSVVGLGPCRSLPTFLHGRQSWRQPPRRSAGPRRSSDNVERQSNTSCSVSCSPERRPWSEGAPASLYLVPSNLRPPLTFPLSVWHATRHDARGH